MKEPKLPPKEAADAMLRGLEPLSKAGYVAVVVTVEHGPAEGNLRMVLLSGTASEHDTTAILEAGLALARALDRKREGKPPGGGW